MIHSHLMRVTTLQRRCVLDVKADIEEEETSFGLHKQMTGEGMSAALHYYFPYWLTK